MNEAMERSFSHLMVSFFNEATGRAIQLGRVNDVISRFPQIKSTLRPEILILRHFLEAVTSKT